MEEEEARPVCRHPSACPTGPCRKEGLAWSPPNLLMEEEKEVDKKEDDYDDGGD